MIWWQRLLVHEGTLDDEERDEMSVRMRLFITAVANFPLLVRPSAIFLFSLLAIFSCPMSVSIPLGFPIPYFFSRPAPPLLFFS